MCVPKPCLAADFQAIVSDLVKPLLSTTLFLGTTLLLPLHLRIFGSAFQRSFLVPCLVCQQECILSKPCVLAIFFSLRLGLLFSRSLTKSPPVSTSIAFGQAQPSRDSPLSLVIPQDPKASLSSCLSSCLVPLPIFMVFSEVFRPPFFFVYKLFLGNIAHIFSLDHLLFVDSQILCLHASFIQSADSWLTAKMHRGKARLQEDMRKQPL